MPKHHGPGLMLSDELPPERFATLVELAEAAGYVELWYTDQRFWRDCYAGLALAAQHSRQLRLGPGVNDPFTRHPALIAMAIATLHEQSGGRAQLGLGVGGSGIREMRLPHDRPVRALREAIEIIRLMLQGDTVHYDGQIFHLEGGRLGFGPPKTSIPIFVASHSPQVLRLCGQLADGVLLGNMARRSAVEEAVEFIREGERAANRSRGSVHINLRLEACIDEGGGQSMNTIKRRFAERLVATYPRWDYLERLGVVATSSMRVAAADRDIAAVQDQLTDEDVQGTALVGNSDSVAHQLKNILTEDVEQVTIRPYEAPGLPQELTVRAFAEKVWPISRS